MDLELNDKVAFIAGSTRGIGLAIARAFLREAAKVVITGRNADSLEEAVASLAKVAGTQRVLSVQGDMTDAVNIRRALDETVSTFGGIDAVFVEDPDFPTAIGILFGVVVNLLA